MWMSDISNDICVDFTDLTIEVKTILALFISSPKGKLTIPYA